MNKYFLITLLLNLSKVGFHEKAKDQSYWNNS